MACTHFVRLAAIAEALEPSGGDGLSSGAKEKAIFLRWLSRHLSGFAYMYSNEKQLHDAVAVALDQEGINYQREVVDGDNRFDFVVEDGVIIEIKVHGSLSEVLRQITRYCGLPGVNAVLVAATCTWARGQHLDQPFVAGKPVEFAHLRRQAL